MDHEFGRDSSISRERSTRGVQQIDFRERAADRDSLGAFWKAPFFSSPRRALQLHRANDVKHDAAKFLPATRHRGEIAFGRQPGHPTAIQFCVGE